MRPCPLVTDEQDNTARWFEAYGWRFSATDVPYSTPRAVALGGPIAFATVAGASAIARRRARRSAEALAAPQWRALGELRVVVAEDRLLIWHAGEWASVWYHAIRGLYPDLAVNRLDIFFENDPPYCLVGPEIPQLAASLAERLGPVAISG